MSTPLAKSRWMFLVLFGLFSLPCLTFVSLFIKSLSWLWFIDTTIRAVPLYAAIWFDALFYDGGELSPELIPLWVALTALILWPLLALGIRPLFWASPRWRRAIFVHAATAVVCTIPAAYWIFGHTGYLF